jgi:hypothetical protein
VLADIKRLAAKAHLLDDLVHLLHLLHCVQVHHNGALECDCAEAQESVQDADDEACNEDVRE